MEPYQLFKEEINIALRIKKDVEPLLASKELHYDNMSEVRKYRNKLKAWLNKAPKNVPQTAIITLQNQLHGSFNITVTNSKYLVRLHHRYGSPVINIRKEKEASTRDVNIVKNDINELHNIIAQFGSSHNSNHGNALVNNFLSATENLINRINHQYSKLNTAVNEFENALNALITWKNNSWWQAGGQPQNHHKARSHDKAEITRNNTLHGTKVGNIGNSF